MKRKETISFDEEKLILIRKAISGYLEALDDNYYSGLSKADYNKLNEIYADLVKLTLTIEWHIVLSTIYYTSYNNI